MSVAWGGGWIGAREAGRGENETGVAGTMNVMRNVAGAGVGRVVDRRVIEGVGIGGSGGVRPATDQVAVLRILSPHSRCGCMRCRRTATASSILNFCFTLDKVGGLEYSRSVTTQKIDL